MIRKGSKPTAIERLVLERIRRGEEPAPNRLRQAVDLQAITRLRERGYVEFGYVEGDCTGQPRYYLTEEGARLK